MRCAFVQCIYLTLCVYAFVADCSSLCLFICLSICIARACLL